MGSNVSMGPNIRVVPISIATGHKVAGIKPRLTTQDMYTSAFLPLCCCLKDAVYNMYNVLRNMYLELATL